MTIFRFNLLLLAVVSWPSVQSASAEQPDAETAEIVQIVSQPNDVAAQTDAKAWIERHRHDMADMGRKLVDAGFRREEEGQPYPGCYTYAGRRDGTDKEIIASFLICPGRPPVAFVSTLLPVDKNPKGPLPVITPPITTERGR